MADKDTHDTFIGKGGGLYSYEGIHKKDRVLIYKDGDSLDIKFLKMMQFKLMKTHISTHSGKITDGQLHEWFKGAMQVSKKDFVMMLNHLDWHTLHPTKKTGTIGTQLDHKQLTKLVDLLVNGVHCADVSLEMIQQFCLLKEHDMKAYKDELRTKHASMELEHEKQKELERQQEEIEEMKYEQEAKVRKEARKALSKRTMILADTVKNSIGLVGDHRVRAPLHCIHTFGENTGTEEDGDVEEFLQVILAQT
jgi:hypothetical protein